MTAWLLFIALVFPAKTGFCADGQDAPSGLVRVGIVQSEKSADITTAGKTSLFDAAGGKIIQISAGTVLKISAANGGLVLGDYKLGSPAKLTPLEGEKRLKLNGKAYRGSLVIKASEGAVTVVEELDIEEYLYGVLPLEMGADWPLEALKAQAVAARTYALFNLGRFEDAGYDLSADVRSQAYAGADKDDPKIIEAVRSTSGEVLSFKGKLLHAFFHASCGGHTSSPVWGGGQATPLSGVRCRWCLPSRYYNWRIRFSEDKILAILSECGLNAEKVKGIRVAKRNSSGRALSFKFSTDKGSKIIDTNLFRRRLGNSDFKSALIIHILPKKNGFEFVGRGYGHGVGMCQDGAKYMAWSGKTYKQILRYYYPGAKLADWKK